MDASGINGRWHPTRAELDGELAPAIALEPMRLLLQPGTYAFQFGDENSDEGLLEVSDGPDYLVLTLQSVQGVNAGKIIPGIAQLRGDRLRICFGLNGTAPTLFETSAGSSKYLVMYRRG